MNFLETVFSRLREDPGRASLSEVHGKTLKTVSRGDLLDLVSRARGYLRQAGVRPGDRVVLLGPNSIRWAACDLAVLAEGAMCVPLYHRQAPGELAFMRGDCEPKLVIDSDEAWADVFTGPPISESIHPVRPEDVVTIIYTSGTSGEPKGAMITRANVDYMLERTIDRLREATGRMTPDDRVFHYLPWCFAGSRIMLWTQLFRGNPLMVSTDLKNLAEELATAQPNYYLNVPAMLERVRAAVTEKLRAKGRLIRWLALRLIKRKIGPRLEFLICGSAPLSEETQRWFERIGIPVLQVYGLTETTAIVTMDRPGRVKAGSVGPAIEGCEIRVGDNGELLCRGPNVFKGYWKRPEATADMLRDGWLHTGDQAELDTFGNLKIVGRVKDILVPASGHNVTPEPLEEMLRAKCPKIRHVLVVGHGRPHLCAIVTGEVKAEELDRALEELNESVPHYKKIRGYHHYREGFSVENGLLTANQKLRRKAIEERLEREIGEMYGKEASA